MTDQVDLNSNILAKLFGMSPDDLMNLQTAQQTQATAQGAKSIEQLVPPPPTRFKADPWLAPPDPNGPARFASQGLVGAQPPKGNFDDFLVNTIEGPRQQAFEDNPEQGQNALRQLGINAKENLGKVASIPYNIYQGLSNLMSKTPVRTEEGKLNPDIIDESFNTAATLAGGGLSRAMITPRAAREIELGMAGSQIGQKRPLLSVQQYEDLKNITNSVEGGWGHSKRVVNEFRAKHPDFVGSDHTIERYMRQFGTRDHRSEMTPEMTKIFNKIHRDYHTRGDLTAKEALKEFYAHFPNYPGSWDGLRTKLSRVPKNLKPEDRVRKLSGRPARGMADDEGFELGSFGGRGSGGGNRPDPKLNTPAYGESVNWLQSQKAVDDQWVKDWARDAGIPIRKVREAGKIRSTDDLKSPAYPTKYIEMLDTHAKNDLNTTHPRVRIPVDPDRHAGIFVKPHEIGHIADTGTGIVGKGAQRWNTDTDLYKNLLQYTTTNKSGMSYANPEALDAWMKWRFSKAPDGRWLIPEEMAPRMPKKTAAPAGPPVASSEHQWKLPLRGHHPDSLRAGRKPTLSLKANDTDITTAMIIEMLKNKSK